MKNLHSIRTRVQKQSRCRGTTTVECLDPVGFAGGLVMLCASLGSGSTCLSSVSDLISQDVIVMHGASRTNPDIVPASRL